MATKRTRLNRIAKYLNQVGRESWSGIPLDAIFSKLEANGFVVLQEDGTRWQGLLCGTEGRATIDLLEFDPAECEYFAVVEDKTGDVIDIFHLPVDQEPDCHLKVYPGYTISSRTRSDYETFQAFHEDAPINSSHAYCICYKPCKHMLCLSWYRRESGRYEVTAYVS